MNYLIDIHRQYSSKISNEYLKEHILYRFIFSKQEKDIK